MVVKKVLFDQFKHALRIFLSKDDLGQDKAFDLLKSSLDDEFMIIRRRIFLLLSFLYDTQAIMGAELKLLSGIKRQIGLALELLDVTLSKELKRYIFLLIDENIPLEKRINDLKTLLNLNNMSRDERLREIITDTKKWWLSWTCACGIYAVALLGIRELVGAIESALGITDQPVRETAVWALHKLDPQIYCKYSAEFLKDLNPQVSELALRLKSNNI